MLTNYQLKQYAKKFLKETYGLDLIVPLELNGRLAKTKGRFVYYTRTKKPKIVELNKFFVENNEPTVVLDVLRHELVHYAMFMLGKPHSDGQYAFENELKRLGIVSQRTIDKYDISTKMQVYKCIMPMCGREYKRNRRLRGNGAFHKCHCGGTLQDMGKRVVTV